MTMEVNHMTNYISRRGKLFQSNYYAKVGVRAKTNTKWKKGDGRRGFLSSSPPPPSFLFFALVLGNGYGYSFFFFSFFVVSLFFFMFWYNFVEGCGTLQSNLYV